MLGQDDPVIGDVLRFCLLSGLRAGEAAGLLRDDLVSKGNLGTFEGHASGPETEAFQGVVRRVLEQFNDPVALGALYNALLHHEVAPDFNAKSLDTMRHATPVMRVIQESSKQISTERLEEYLNERDQNFITQSDLVHFVQSTMHANVETIRHKMLELGWHRVSVKWGGVDYARVVWLRSGCSAQRGEVIGPDGTRQPIRDKDHVEIDI